MEKLDFTTLVLGMIKTNCYIIKNPITKEAIIIDPADEAEKISQYLKANDLVCRAILLTHGHFDHIMAAKALAKEYETLIYAHEAEAELLGDARLNSSYHMRRNYSVIPDVLLKDGEIIQPAGFTIEVIHTPGHTAGGVCYHFKDNMVLFSGDTLFYEDIGRSDLPTGNLNTLVESITQKLMALEDAVRVYPGHGDPTTIGHERENNRYI